MFSVNTESFKKLCNKKNIIPSNTIFGFFYPNSVYRYRYYVNQTNQRLFISANDKLIVEEKNPILNKCQKLVPLNFLANDLENFVCRELSCYLQSHPKQYGFFLFIVSSLTLYSIVEMLKNREHNKIAPVHPFYY